MPTSEQLKQREQLLTKVHELELKTMSESTNLPERMAPWEKEMAHQGNNWTILEPKDWQNFATKFEKQEDGSLLGGGDLQPGGTMRVWAETQATNITGLRLEALTNANLIYGGPGLVGKGSFIVKEFTVEAWALNNPTVTNSIKFRRAIADASAPGFNVTNAIDGNTNSGWVPCATPDHRNQSHCAVFECAEPFGFPGGTRMEITIHQLFDREKDAPRDKLSKLDCHMLGCLRLSTTTDDGPLNVDGLNERVRQALALAPGERSLEQRRVLFEQFARYDGGFTNLNKEVSAEFEKWPYPPTTLVLKQRPQPRVTHMFKRGDRLRPGDEVQPDVLSVLNPFPAEAPKNRLGLAKWLVAPQSPTTARVLVNRMWQSYFGQGLVTTPEDFGTRVEEPSHPELLDWLACELMQPTAIAAESPTPWSIKHIHRLIVNSATYRQSSRVSPELLAKDQYNRLLARGPRFRVEAEVVQDIALSASGLLNLKVGGPSVYPPIPASVGDTVYGGFSWNETKGDDRYRRGLYTFWKRSLPFPSLIAFDMPPGENSCTRRVRSNTPLQALTTLNEKTFVESAQAMALKIMKKRGS